MKKQSFSIERTFLCTHQRSSFISFKWLTFLVISIFAWGCQKVSEETGLVGVCPLVVSTSPVDESVNVTLNSPVRAKFNEVMNASSITATSFTLRQGSNLVAGVVT